MSKGKQTTIQRLWRALFPVKRAAAKPQPGICSECGQSFMGNRRQLTCGKKPCLKARKLRLLQESAVKHNNIMEA